MILIHQKTVIIHIIITMVLVTIIIIHQKTPKKCSGLKRFCKYDSAYIYFVKFFKSFIIFLSYYLFSILEENSIYEILDFHIFISSQYYLFSILLSLFILFQQFFYKIKIINLTLSLS